MIAKTDQDTTTPKYSSFIIRSPSKEALIIAALFVGGLLTQYSFKGFHNLVEKTLVLGSCAAFYLFFDNKEQRPKISRIENTKKQEPSAAIIDTPSLHGNPIEKISQIGTIDTVILPENKEIPSLINVPFKTEILKEISANYHYLHSSGAPLTTEERGVRLMLKMKERDFQKMAPGLRALFCKEPYALGKKLEEKNLNLEDFLKMSHIERYKLLIKETPPVRPVSKENVSQAVRHIEPSIKA